MINTHYVFEETTFSVQGTLQFIYLKKQHLIICCQFTNRNNKEKTRNTTCTKFLRQNKNALTMSQSKMNNAQIQRHMQSTLLLSKNLGKSTCTREKSWWKHLQVSYRIRLPSKRRWFEPAVVLSITAFACSHEKSDGLLESYTRQLVQQQQQQQIFPRNPNI